jgi:hypothetical protein
MSSSTNPLAAFQQFVAQQKAAAPQQGGFLDDYLAARAKQYGTTPKGAKSDTGWTAGETFANPFAGLKQEQEYKVIGEKEGRRYIPTWDESGRHGYIDPEGKFVEGAIPEGLVKATTTPTGDNDASNYYYEPIRSDKLTDVGIDWSGTLGQTFAEQLGHKSTFTKAYRLNEKGNPVEVNDPSLADIQSGKVIFMVGGKTGGTERERMAQAYIPQGDKLIPVGDPSYYKGEHPDARNVATALKFAAIASLPFGGAGALLGNVTGGVASGIASLGIPQMAANIGANALTSGIVQGAISKGLGGDFSKGFKSGAISGGIGAGVGELGAMSGLDKGLGSLYTPAKSLATSALTAKALGRPFDFGQAAKSAAINYGIGRGLQTAGVDPKAFNAFMQFAGPALMQKRRPGGR